MTSRVKCTKYLTTQQASYVRHPQGAGAQQTSPSKQTDPALITGHWANNLKNRKCNQVTKVWPKSTKYREEFADYLETLRETNCKIYQKYFTTPDIDYETLENNQKDKQRSCYMSCYSPNEFVSLAGIKRSLAIPPCSPNYIAGDYRTTYGTYYNRLQENEHFRRYIRDPSFLHDKSPVTAEELQRKLTDKHRLPYFKSVNPTTYFDTICLPALLHAGDNVQIPGNYTDRHMMRRI